MILYPYPCLYFSVISFVISIYISFLFFEKKVKKDIDSEIVNFRVRVYHCCQLPMRQHSFDLRNNGIKGYHHRHKYKYPPLPQHQCVHLYNLCELLLSLIIPYRWKTIDHFKIIKNIYFIHVYNKLIKDIFQVQDKFLQSNPIPIPVYQHPIELYHETGQKRKNQGVDFKNLILLTKNAMKAHRGQPKSTQHKPSHYIEGKNRGSKSESEVLQWLDKSCPSKTKDFSTANTLVTELRNFEEKNDRKASNTKREKDITRSSERIKPEVPGSNAKTSSERDKNDTRNRRRLYRDVLTNASANQTTLENVFEKR